MIIVDECLAIIDSGTSYYRVPKSFMRHFQNNIGFNQFCDNISNLPNIKIYLKQSNLSIKKPQGLETFSLDMSPDDYITHKNYNIRLTDHNFERIKLKKCLLNFSETKNNSIIFGLKFLMKYYTVFDFGHNLIGFSNYESHDEKYQVSYKDLLNKSEINYLIKDWIKIYG